MVGREEDRVGKRGRRRERNEQVDYDSCLVYSQMAADFENYAELHGNAGSCDDSMGNVTTRSLYGVVLCQTLLKVYIERRRILA